MADCIREEGTSRIGRRVILPSTFQESPRNMVALYQDSLAIIARFGKPDLIITFTATPDGVRLRKMFSTTRRSLIDQTLSIPSKAYFATILDDIIKKGVFGQAKAFMWVVEFQKRGLPHCHLLVCLTDCDKFRSPDDVDKIIWAHIPNPQFRRLFNIVTQFNLHGRCGERNGDAACMNLETGFCSKRFPKAFCTSTRMDVGGFPECAHPRDGFVYTASSEEVVNNQWVVPYNWYLSCKHKAHINVELCSTISAVKYLNKYIYKGLDRARVILRSEDESLKYDEIRAYLDARYVCPQEAAWKLLGFPLHDRSHTVVRLPVHLPDQQEVFFREGEEREAVRCAASSSACLTAQGRWEKRRRFEKAIGRMYTVSPREGERFHLRIMLLHTSGPTSFESTKNVHGTQYGTFKEAASAAGYFAMTKSIARVNVNNLITPPQCEPPNINEDVVDITSLREEEERMYQTLNTQQKLVVDTVLAIQSAVSL
uniref:Helitron_like_N domain-containing protein n=1 Tax=Heligmosomoides polygyrus TaxID=6339 RepID=A0A183GEZ6_HELPZ